LLLTLAIGVAPTFAQNVSGNPIAAPRSDVASAVSALLQHYPAASIHTVESADLALREVAQVRYELDARFTEDQRLCYSKFFAAHCVDDAKERRRHALAQLRPIEIEANQFKRRAVVIERDQALSDKRAEEERDAPRRAAQQLEYERAADEKARERAHRAADVEANQQLHSADAAKREAEHQVKLRSIQAEDAASAQKRADSSAAFERKRLQSEARQREVAAKKAEKDRERASRAPLPPPVAPAAGAPPATNPASVPGRP
jgi:hypothetical protein